MHRFLFACALLVLVACAAPMAVAPTQVVVPTAAQPIASPTTPAPASTATCTTTNAAPPDKFRADDPTKLEANNNKPKLVEFFAYW